MFTRIVEVTAKNGKARELSRTIDEKVLALLRQQPGFVDEITLISREHPDRLLALSFWNSAEDAERYSREGFSKVNEIIRNLITDPPQVRTFDVATSTINKLAAGRAA
jgi:heme-degrading monooxygenase HmoA